MQMIVHCKSNFGRTPTFLGKIETFKISNSDRRCPFGLSCFLIGEKGVCVQPSYMYSFTRLKFEQGDFQETGTAQAPTSEQA